jgi:hypothetical protein
LLRDREDIEVQLTDSITNCKKAADLYLSRAARAVREPKQAKWMKLYAQFLRRELKDRRTSENWLKKYEQMKK